MELDENQQDYKVVSSLASHFGTNYTPTDDELLQIHNLLVEPSVRISELEVEMARKAAEYDAIVEKHAKLMRLVADYRALASPMRRLPVDLLREVFYHCLPTAHNAILSHKEAPAVLTHVCRTWRAVALATPVLWASLHIPVPQPMPDDMFFRSDLEREGYRTSMTDALWKRTTAMKEWLARSGACGLSISLHGMQHPNYRVLNTNYEEFLNTIMLHSKRWRSITFTCSAEYLISVSALTAEDVPALEELVINMTSHFSQPPADFDPLSPSILNWAKSSFLSAPRLHRVSFVHLSGDINMLPLRWQQLTYLSLTGVPIGWENRFNQGFLNIAALLAKCPGLVSARLEISSDAQSSAGAGPPQHTCRSPLLLPHLIELALQNGVSDISSFFAMLDVPRLTTLSYYTYTMKPAGEFIALVRRSSDTLVTLTINAAMFSREDFFSLLKAARRLKSLSNRLGRTIEPPNPWEGNEEQNALHFDNVFLGMLVGKRLSLPKLDAEGDAKSQEEKVQTAEVVADGYSSVLLPELESFDSCRLVSFTGEGLLECLMLRQGLADGRNDSVANSEIARSAPYCKFKHFSVPFCRGDILPLSDQIPFLTKDGLALHLPYPPAKVFDYFSPAEGVVDEMASSLYQISA
ncbi:hypothetical protein BJ912DRAFT_1146979 [Pholiota molesta]|nr:hypothetical protein BJ912DRAFT_1146979 [Pholiota molesta]